MTVQAWVILDADQKAAAETLNTEDASVYALPINNPLSNNLGFSVLVGLFVIPARVLNDPSYAAWYPTLGTYPIHVMDSETLFLPVEA